MTPLATKAHTWCISPVYRPWLHQLPKPTPGTLGLYVDRDSICWAYVMTSQVQYMKTVSAYTATFLFVNNSAVVTSVETMCTNAKYILSRGYLKTQNSISHNCTKLNVLLTPDLSYCSRNFRWLRGCCVVPLCCSSQSSGGCPRCSRTRMSPLQQGRWGFCPEWSCSHSASWGLQGCRSWVILLCHDLLSEDCIQACWSVIFK